MEPKVHILWRLFLSLEFVIFWGVTSRGGVQEQRWQSLTQGDGGRKYRSFESHTFWIAPISTLSSSRLVISSYDQYSTKDLNSKKGLLSNHLTSFNFSIGYENSPRIPYFPLISSNKRPCFFSNNNRKPKVNQNRPFFTTLLEVFVPARGLIWRRFRIFRWEFVEVGSITWALDLRFDWRR